MTNRCAKCGRFMDPLAVSRAWCPRCFQAELDKPWSEVLADRVLDVWCGPRRTEQENWWQDVSEPETPKREPFMALRFQAAREAYRQGILLMRKWRGYSATAIFCDEYQAFQNQQEDEMKQEVKAGQTWANFTGEQYTVIGPDRYNSNQWHIKYIAKGLAACFDAYAICGDKLLKDERGDPVEHHCLECGTNFAASGPHSRFYTLCKKCYENHGDPEDQGPEVPEEVETEVKVDESGGLYMHLVEPDGSRSPAAAPTAQSYGRNGYLCQGFHFREDPGTIYPNAIGWTGPNNPGRSVSMYRIGDFTEETIAHKAVWKKLGS